MRLGQLIIKDIKNIVYDVKSLAILIVMPVVIMSILGVALKGVFGNESGSGITSMNIAVVKQYDAAKEIENFQSEAEGNALINQGDVLVEDINLDRIFFEEFLENKEIQEIITYTVVDETKAKELIETDEIAAIVYLPEGFVYDGLVNFTSLGRNKVKINIVTHQDYAFSNQILISILEGFSEKLNIEKARNSAFIGDLISKGVNEHIGDIVANLPENMINNTETILEHKSANRQKSITSFQYYATAMMSMFLLYSAAFGGKAILSEKHEYTLARLSVTGISIEKVVISNFVRVSLICILQSSFMIIYSNVVLGIEWGSLITIIIGTLIMSITVGALAMLLSVITLATGSFSFASFFEFAIIQFMALVGGSFLPLEVLPEAIGNLSFLSISGLGIKIYTNAMYELPLSANIGTYTLLLSYAVVLVLIAFIMIKVNGKKVKAC